MLPLHARFEPSDRSPPDGVYKVLSLDEALASRHLLPRIIVDLRPSTADVDQDALASFGLAGALVRDGGIGSALPIVGPLSNPDVVGAGDVLRVHRSGQLNVLFRRGANANTLFATERCNSRCLMCSQPPREEEDGWRLREMAEVIDLIDRGLPVMGITGGEPTLHGVALADVLAYGREQHPTTTVHVLTNGRTFVDASFASAFDGAVGQVVWAVPLYSDVAHRHDYLVQAKGAFFETLHGIYNLAERRHRIELRCVLCKPTLDRLGRLSEFIGRNLPFVEHVALMGLEPMGYARHNRELLWVDPADYGTSLLDAAAHLELCGLPVSIYNLPLCALPREAHRYARASISDWKNVFLPDCDACIARASCSGFFRSAGSAWISRAVKPISEFAPA